MNAIYAKNITRKFGSRTVLDNISFEVAESEFLVVFGPSGCGKTTLLRIIAGLDLPDSGEIFVRGKMASGGKLMIPACRRNLGFVFQEPALWPHMTVEENISFGIRNTNKNAACEKAFELMERTSILHLKGKYPDQISGGEARRVSLARSLAPNPSCILMDEPLTNLDAKLKGELLDFMLQRVRETEAALIYVTHDADEAERISSNRLILDLDLKGRES